MKKLKTAILIFLSVLFFSTLFFFFPPKKLIGQLPFLNRFYNNTSLEIVTQRGKAKIWINEKDYGETPVTVQDLPEGNYLVEMEKIAPEDAFYKKHSFNIELTKNTTARMDIEIGPEDLLHGSILYYSPMKTSPDKGYLTVTCSTNDSKIYVNGEFTNRASLTNIELEKGEQKIKVENDGYIGIELPVNIRENYQLNLKIYQLPIPISLED
ncbi:PEGA domain-containing protein [Candidatus Dojkabacteria bacterium]|uniref:PEGA domain-containing protein n=1 Tax=Candidatus Dojkabacteria bacterium TaxID=2099670 RepID=A0A847CZZ5_9BACT|nr:PEGA domain-containing protein [Candidatus Dojkabacteria bacterium]